MGLFKQLKKKSHKTFYNETTTRFVFKKSIVQMRHYISVFSCSIVISIVNEGTFKYASAAIIF